MSNNDPEPNHPSCSNNKRSTRRRRRWLWPLVVLLLIAATTGIYLGLWDLNGRFATVHEGHLYRSGLLSEARLAKLCKRYGIRTVVDFRREDEHPEIEAEALEKIGVNHVNLQSEQVPTPEVVEGFLEVMSNPANQPVLIHCLHGVGRTGLHAAIYRMEFQGWTNEKALREARLLSGFDSFEVDTGKGEFILNYQPRSVNEVPGH